MPFNIWQKYSKTQRGCIGKKTLVSFVNEKKLLPLIKPKWHPLDILIVLEKVTLELEYKSVVNSIQDHDDDIMLPLY